MKKQNKLQDKNGFTLIEGLVGAAIFLLVFLTLFSLFGAIFGAIRNNKSRITANSIALEQLEIVRSMDYNDVATNVGWNPPGEILQERTFSRAGFSYAVRVDITFVDDPYDGEDPADTFHLDYKKVRVKVSWTNPVNKNQETVAMSTTVVPEGLEGLGPDKGGLFITVFNASGEVISGANVHIESASAAYLGDYLTDLNGNLWAADLDPADDYHIVATKAGYSADQTYPIITDSSDSEYNPNPIKPDATVIAEEITQIGFAIDILGTLNIETANYDNPQNWLINTNLGTSDQINVAVDIDSGDNLFLIWRDDRDGPVRLYAQKYKHNEGSGVFEKQWPSDIQITTADNKESPGVATFGTDYFYVLGVDDRNVNKDVFLDKYNSADGSNVWGNITVNVEANGDAQVNGDVAVDFSGNTYIVWMDNRNGDWDIYAQKRDINGNALWATDLKINNDASSSDQENPKVIIDDDDNFYVVWEDEINGDKDVFMAKFDADGNTLFAGKKINADNSGLDQYEPSIDFDGSDYLYISWTDKRNSQPDIYAQKYDKDGNIAVTGNWADGDVKINDDSLPDAWRTSSSVAYSVDGTVYFSWEDDRNGNLDVYSAKFDSDGAKLWLYDLIMNGAFSEDQENPDIITDSFGYAITVWEDSRNGNFDIYAARYKELDIFIRTDVSITITGAKIKGTYPNPDYPPTHPENLPIYKYSETFLSDVNGYIIGVPVEWDNYSFDAVSPHSIVSVDQPEPLTINPGEEKDVIINVEP